MVAAPDAAAKAVAPETASEVPSATAAAPGDAEKTALCSASATPAPAASSGSRQLALVAARAAWDKKAADIVIQEVGAALSITDYFVIVSGANSRQVDAIQEAVEAALRASAGIKPLGREGMSELTWVLLDYGDIVVHVFQPQTREFYRLESLWNDVPIIDLREEGIVQDDYPDWLARALHNGT
jgi:ribosome-associated protein